MIVLPAIDILNKKCVRLLQGDYAKKIEYNDDPVNTAEAFVEKGLKYIHVVDLDGASTGNMANRKIVRRICSIPGAMVQNGGGIRTIQDVRKMIKLGVYQVNLGTAAIENPLMLEKVVKEFGSDRIVISIDVKNGRLKVKGWLEESKKSIDDLISTLEKVGITNIIYTDIERDGMQSKPDFKNYKNLINTYPNLKITAAGGISCIEDIEQLGKIGIQYAIVGKAIYEGAITLEQLTRYSC